MALKARSVSSDAFSYTLSDAARLSGLSISTLRRRAKEGDLSLVYVGRRALVDGNSLRRMLGVCSLQANLMNTAHQILIALIDVLNRQCAPNQPVLSAICAHAPSNPTEIERLSRESLPLLAEAARIAASQPR